MKKSVMHRASAIIAGFVAAVTCMTVQANEQPKYRIVDSIEEIEVREYAPSIVAEVTVRARSVREATNWGFTPLARYIFGNNKPQAKIAMTAPVTAQQGVKIAMTAPVTAEEARANEFLVRFSMPAEWSMASLPEPLDPAVRLVELPSRMAAVIRYVGRDSEAIRTAVESALLAYASENRYTVIGPPIWAGYDGPNRPRSQRRFEIMLPVEPADS